MTAQQLLVKMTQDAVDGLFRYAHALPADRLTWKPMDTGRTAIDMLQECAQAPVWFHTILTDRAMPPMSRAELVASRRERQEWTTVGECERVCRFNTARLCELILSYPEADFDIIVTLPFAPGGSGIQESLWKVASRHLQNTIYHTGQIAYIQVLLGDKDPH